MVYTIFRDTRYEIDLDALGHNIARVQAIVADQAGRSDRPKVAAVLKSDAYGFGAIPTARLMVEMGIDFLAVACLPEALELRKAFPQQPILIMGYTPDPLLSLSLEQDIHQTIFHVRQAEILSRYAVEAAKQANVHVKIDTGMNRLGLDPDEQGVKQVMTMAALPGINLEGMFTHLALESRQSDYRQFERFMDFSRALEKQGLEIPIKHVCDSIGMLRYPEFRLDMVRPGAIFYGAPPMRTPYDDLLDIRVPFALKTRISRLRTLAPGEGVGYDFSWKAPETGAVLATLPIGYSDGYKRALSNKGYVLIRGHRAPLAGLICMDQCTVDVTTVPGVQAGDDVLLLGQDSMVLHENGQKADSGPAHEIPVLEMAGWLGTNRNEVLTAIGRRVPRVYRKKGTITEVKDYLIPG